jgi:hypothetical protein
MGKKGVTESVYHSMRTRCYCPAVNKWEYYGGRGIKVCDRWMVPKGDGLRNFRKDMGERPSKEYSIDRIDNDGNYSPENCRWILKSKNITHRGKKFVFGRNLRKLFLNGLGLYKCYRCGFIKWECEMVRSEFKRCRKCNNHLQKSYYHSKNPMAVYYLTFI